MQRTSEENWHLTAAYEPAQCNHLARLLSHNKASAVQVAAAKQADHHNQIGWVHVTKLHKCMQTDSKWCRCESNRRNLAIGILHVDICLCHQRNKTHQCHLLMFAYEASDCNGPDLDVTRDDPDFSDDREVFVKAPVHCCVNFNGCYFMQLLPTFPCTRHL